MGNNSYTSVKTSLKKKKKRKGRKHKVLYMCVRGRKKTERKSITGEKSSASWLARCACIVENVKHICIHIKSVQEYAENLVVVASGQGTYKTIGMGREGNLLFTL